MRRHRWMASGLAAIVLVLALAGCGGDDDDSTDGDSLSDTSWTLAKLGDADALADPATTIAFRAEGAFDGNTGCNKYDGSWSTPGDELVIELGGITPEVCADPVMQQEKDFLAALAASRSYEASGDELTLLDETGKSLAMLNAAE